MEPCANRDCSRDIIEADDEAGADAGDAELVFFPLAQERDWDWTESGIASCTMQLCPLSRPDFTKFQILKIDPFMKFRNGDWSILRL